MNKETIKLYNAYKTWKSFENETYKGKSKTVEEWDEIKLNYYKFKEFCVQHTIETLDLK